MENLVPQLLKKLKLKKKNNMGIFNQNLDELFKSKIVPVLTKNIDEGRKIVQEKIGPDTKEFLEDDNKCNQLFGLLYYILPLPVQMVISKDKFKNYCLNNRQYIINIFTDEK
jgi:hypothetical protein